MSTDLVKTVKAPLEPSPQSLKWLFNEAVNASGGDLPLLPENSHQKFLLRVNERYRQQLKQLQLKRLVGAERNAFKWSD